MVKAIWAVACSVGLAGLLIITLWGCGTAPAKTGGAASIGETLQTSSSEQAVASPVPASAAVSGPKYQIGPEDVLHVSVWDNKELTLDVVVRPDGKISIPLIQDIQAEGLTADELADQLTRRLTAFIKDPQVSVIVTQVNAPKIYVMGNVARPGTYPLRSEMSVLQALSLAGGFTTFASPKNMRLVRNGNGKQEVRRINYYDMVDEGEGNYLLKPGDTIVVP